MSEKLCLEWEELRAINPWKDLFDNKTIEELRCQICAWNTPFVHPDDKEVIMAHNNNTKIKDSNKFELFKLPKPYRGNLRNPKLVILSLNPGFNDRVNRVMFNMLAPKYQTEFIELSRKNLLLEDGCRVITNEVDDVLDNGYWTRRLSDLEKDKADLSKIGLIQFIPYATKDYSSWKEEASLKTQDFTREIIRYLVHKTETLFLVMRSKEQWEKIIEKEMKEYSNRFMYNRNPRNQKLSSKNLKDDDAPIKDQYQRILNALKIN